MVRSRKAPNVLAPRQVGFGEHFGPREDGAAGEQRRDMAAAIDGGDVERVGEPVEGKRAGDRDHMPAINQPAAEAPLLGSVQVEMNARGVLIEPGRGLMFGFLDCDPDHVIDALADLVVAEAMRAAGERKVVSRNVERRAGFAQNFRIEYGGQARYVIAGRRCGLVAFLHHHPADVFKHGGAVLIGAGGAHINDPGLTARILFEPDDLGERAQRIARINRCAEVAAGIAEIGDGIERDIGDGLAEDDVEYEQVVDRRTRITDRLGKLVRRLHCEAWPEQAVVKGDIAGGHRSRGGVTDHLADAEILKAIAGTGFRH